MARPSEFLEYVRLDNRRARDLMTAPATGGTSISEIADLLQRHRIKRVPIVLKAAGIVNRTDLVRALVRTPDASVNPD